MGIMPVEDAPVTKLQNCYEGVRYCINYLLLNIVCAAIPHPKLRAFYLRLLGATIGKNVRIEHVSFIQIQYPICNLQCGDNVFIGSSVILDLSEKIILDDFSIIGPGCTILTHQDLGDFNGNVVSKIYKSKMSPTHLKENSVICGDSTLLAGTVIGRLSVVGAKSLVKGDLPDNSLYAGNPATFIRFHGKTNTTEN